MAQLFQSTEANNENEERPERQLGRLTLSLPPSKITELGESYLEVIQVTALLHLLRN